MADRKLTLGKTAKGAGLHYMTVKAMFEDENIQRYDAEVLNKLCKFFGCQPGDILVYEDDPPY